MSSVAVYREGKFSHFLKFSKALKKVAAGSWRFRDDARTELEEIPYEARPHKHVFHDHPNNVHFVWKPRPSGVERIRIWQARYAKQAK